MPSSLKPSLKKLRKFKVNNNLGFNFNGTVYLSFRLEFITAEDAQSWTIAQAGAVDKYFVKVFASPMKIEFYSGGKKVAVFNGRNTLKFEHLRKKPDV